ncbi:MAG: TIGR02996 domain-containing protein [Polyangiaceae bacterium]
MEKELLDEILARPDDDDPRVVYADWLVSRGDPRGEFIHIQCQRGGGSTRRVGRWANMPDSELGTREQELLKKHEKEWIRPFYGRLRPVWRRGFIDYVSLNGVQFVEFMTELIERAPLAFFDLRKVTSGHCDAMAAAPIMRGARRLSLAIPKVTARSLKLLASPHLSGLRRLRVDLMYGNTGIEILREATGLTSLEHLDLSNTYGYVPGGREVYHALTAKQLDAITAGPTFARLGSFTFECHNKVADCVPELLSRGTSLRTLSVQNCGLPDQSIAALLSAPGLAQLEEVHLVGNELGPQTLAVLTGARPPPSLKRLNIVGIGVNPEARRREPFGEWTAALTGRYAVAPLHFFRM